MPRRRGLVGKLDERGLLGRGWDSRAGTLKKRGCPGRDAPAGGRGVGEGRGPRVRRGGRDGPRRRGRASAPPWGEGPPWGRRAGQRGEERRPGQEKRPPGEEKAPQARPGWRESQRLRTSDNGYYVNLMTAKPRCAPMVTARERRFLARAQLPGSCRAALPSLPRALGARAMLGSGAPDRSRSPGRAVAPQVPSERATRGHRQTGLSPDVTTHQVKV